MQIARTLPWHGPGGMETHAWELARAWHRRGWSVDVLTTSFEDRDTTEEREGIRIHSLEHLPRNRDDVPPWRWWHRFAARVHAYARQRGLRPHVVHAESLYGHRWFAALARMGDSAVRVATIHGTGLQVYRETGRPRLLERVPSVHPRAIGQWILVKARGRAERRELATAHRIVAVSDALGQNLCDDYSVPPDRVDVIPNGITPSAIPLDRPALRRAWSLPIEGRVILYLGRLEASKRIERLIEHIRRRPDDQLLVAGVGDHEAILRRAAANVPGPDRVQFLGRVDEAQKRELLAMADVLALPSDSEGQPISLLEALAAGTPAYASRPWVPSDLVDLLATGDDVTRGIEDAAGKRPLVEARRPAIQSEYSWDRIAERYEAVFSRAKP